MSVRIRLATNLDLEELVRLENIGFNVDRFTEGQIDYLLTRARSSIFLAEIDSVVVGAAYMLWREQQRAARLYNLVVDPAVQGKGLGRVLMDECELEAAQRGCDEILLEVRSDNKKGIAFYEKRSYRIIRTLNDYYEDGQSGLKMSGALDFDIAKQIRLDVPYYHQTLDFTCGPACLMMAFKHHDTEFSTSRLAELNLWKESTLVFMTSGIGGTDPFGLALAAQTRGLTTRVMVSSDKTPFIKTVRKDDKRDVIRLVHNDLKSRAIESGVGVVFCDYTFADIVSALHRHMLPIVLISTYRLTGDRAPHWTIVTGFDGDSLYLHDPDIDSYEKNRSLARNIKLSRQQFERMRQYGRSRYKAAVFVGPHHNLSLKQTI